MSSKVEKVNPYGTDDAKGAQVEQMFDAIAPAYDFMNTAMTLGMHRYWRNRALARLDLRPGAKVLDVATGTGDVAFAIYRQCPLAKVTGIDLSAGMLEIARKRLEKMPPEARKALSFGIGDSLCLSFPDDSFDAVTVAYGVRNFEHLDDGLAEMTRVLKPGGTLCIIELSEPTQPAIRSLYRLYSRRIIPAVGKMVSGDARAYKYLPESIAAAPQRGRLTNMMHDAGLRLCKWKQLTLGVVCIYTGVKPI